MNALLGYSNEVESKYSECKEQIKSLVAQIKEKVESKENNALSKYNLESDEKDGGFKTNEATFIQQQILKGHSDKIYALQWSSDSKNLVSASQDGSLVIWDMTNKSYAKKLGIPLRMSWVMTVAYSPNGNLVASGGLDNLCSVFNIENKYGWASGNSPHRELQQHEGYVSCARFVDDNHILTASGDGSCIYWDIEYQQPSSLFHGHNGDVDSVAHNEVDKNIFVSGSIDTSAKVWDYRTSNCIKTFTGHRSDVNCVKWFPDYMSFGTASDDGQCRLFDLKSYQTINIYGQKMEENTAVTCIDFSKSGYYLLAAYDEGPTCLSWNTATSEQEKLLNHPARVSALEFSPNGYGLVTGCWDKNLRVWV